MNKIARLSLVVLFAVAASVNMASAGITTFTFMTKADADAGGSGGGHAFYFGQLFDKPTNDRGSQKFDFYFGPDAKTLSFSFDDKDTADQDDDTAKFQGSIVDLNEGEDYRFDFDIDFDRVPDGDADPKTEYDFFDTTDWTFWQITAGSFVGQGDLEGALMTIMHKGEDGSFGTMGANQKNANQGFSTWFKVKTVDQPDNSKYKLKSKGHGDINIDIPPPTPDKEIPIPPTFLLVGAGLGILGLSRRRS